MSERKKDFLACPPSCCFTCFLFFFCFRSSLARASSFPREFKSTLSLALFCDPFLCGGVLENGCLRASACERRGRKRQRRALFFSALDFIFSYLFQLTKRLVLSKGRHGSERQSGDSDL